MGKCCISGCQFSSKPGVPLHRFPTKNLPLRKSWIRFALFAGTSLAQLDMPDRSTNSANIRICCQHFVDGNRYANPEPTLLPDGRQPVPPPPGSLEANYLTDMDLEARDEAGIDMADETTYRFDIGPYESLEAFIDAKLLELDFSSMMDTATDKLEMKLKQTERKTREVNQIFSHCESQLKLLMADTMDKGVPLVAETDSDDDVMIVQTGFDLERAARSQQQMRAQQKSPLAMGMQQRFQMRNGSLINRPQAPYQASVGRMPFSPLPNTTVRFPKPQVPVPRAMIQNKSAQRGLASGDSPIQMQQRRPLTTMYAPPTKLMDLVVGMKMYAKKVTDIWYRGTLTEIHNKEKPRSEWRYRIKFEGKGMKVVTGREVAFVDTPTDTLPAGSRVVAMYKDEDNPTARSHYAGIVSESPSLRNNKRYLIFFDDGYAQYCYAHEIHKVYEQSRNVWEDVHVDSQEFIKSYLKQYPERPMVRLQSNQVIKTEWNGRWWTARVLETDGSLVKMYFDADKRIEWIYRGSTRLEPLYTELANAEMSKAGKGHRRHNIGMKGSKKPIVEYLRGTDEDFMKRKHPDTQYKKPHEANTLQRSASAGSLPEFKKRSVARKSTAKLQQGPGEERRLYQASSISRNVVGGRDHSQLTDGEALGERMQISRDPDLLHKRFVPHRCDGDCLDGTELDPIKFRGQNPLIIPMLSGWERQISRQKNSAKRSVFYRAPCARRMRGLDEVEHYLRETDSQLSIDLFCYDHMLHTHSEFVPIKTFCDIKDLSYGKETVRISCVNGIDRQYPDYVEYSNQRIPASGVYLNLEADFLTGCDHAGPCGDPDTCSCAALTLEASNAIPGTKPEVLGYQHRRLREPINTGLYECNQRCKCDHRCGNRVAQNGLQLRLQVFKTEKRGWGLRCLDDIPAGGFICVYAGQLLTEQGANEDGQQYGDEYLAELDYIEVVERCKEGYESDVDINEGDGPDQDTSDTSEDQNLNRRSDSDSTFSGGNVRTVNNPDAPNRHSTRRRTKKMLDGEEVEKRSTKLVIKRGADEEKTWSVKMRSPQAKTKAWVDSIPDPMAAMSIVISDEDDDVTNSTSTTQPGNGEVMEKDASVQKKDDITKTAAGKNEAENEKMDNCDELDGGDQNLPKPKKPEETKITLRLKSKQFLSTKLDVDDDMVDLYRRPIRIPRIRKRGIGIFCEDSDKNKDKKSTKDEEKPAMDKDKETAMDEDKPAMDKDKETAMGEDKPAMDNDKETAMDEDKPAMDKDKEAAMDEDKKPAVDEDKKPAVDEDKKPAVDEDKKTPIDEDKPIVIEDKNPASNEPGSSSPGPTIKVEAEETNVKKEIATKVNKSDKEMQGSRATKLRVLEKRAVTTKKEKKKKESPPPPEEEDHGFKTRLLYNNEPFCYVMDAKSNGNIGRYLNHSCGPNVFVQNVFVDTHDMRFPWVAFFAGQFIRSGTELTWDYNYEVGSVPGKVLYCYCGAAECRGRLL